MPYMNSKAIIGAGASISIGPIAGAATPTFVLIGELDNSTPTGRAWAKEKTTNFQSTIDEEYVKTNREPGEWDISGNRIADDAGQLALEAAMDSKANYQFKVVFPLATGQTVSGETRTFNAGVMSVDPTKITPTDVIKFGSKLQLSGSRTIVAGV